LKIFVYIIIFLSIFSCSKKVIKPNNKENKKQKEESLEMEPVVVKKDKIVSLSELFKEANDFVMVNEYNKALLIYSKLKEITSNEDKPLLNYNIAVTYYKMGNFKKALEINLEILKNKSIDNQFLIDVIINITEIYGKNKKWKEINSLLDNYYEKFNFIDNKWDYIELTIRYEVALYHENRLDDAEFKSLKVYRQFKKYRKIFPYLSREQRYFLSMGYFFVGEITRQRFEQILIEGNVKKMTQILDEKSELVLRAQNYYMNSMSFKDKYWATASGYRIGEMYDTFYNQLVSAKINVKLTFEEKIVYKEELKIRIQNLLKKAIAIFEENIIMSERLSENNFWINKTLKRLEDAKTKYLQIKKIEIENEL
jgi:hypothetical protein